MNKLLLLLLLIPFGTIGQTIYSVDQEYKADVKVYVVDQEYKAKKTIFFVDQEYKADLLVYFVDQEYKADWKNSSKQQWQILEEWAWQPQEHLIKSW